MTELMLILGILQLICGLGVFLYEFKRGSLSIFLWAGLLLMFHLPHTLTSFNINVEYPEWSYCMASVFVIGFDLLYLLTIVVLRGHFKKRNVVEKLEYNVNDLTSVDYCYENYFSWVIVITTIIMAIYIYTVSGSLLDSSWGGILGGSSSNRLLSVLFNAIPFFVDVAGGVLLYLLASQKNKKKLILLCVVLIFSIVIRREKQRFLVLAVPFILFAFIKNHRINLKTFVKFLSIGVIGYLGVLFLAFMRDGTLGEFLSNFDFSLIWNYSIKSITSSSGELSLRNAFYKYVTNNNSYLGFNTGADYIRMLLFWLPTSLSFGIKPPDFACTMGSAWLDCPPQYVYSMHPTLYGECFANLYYFGILLAVFWACFIFILDGVVYKKKPYVLRCGISVLVCVNYIMIARGSAYNAFFTIVVSLILHRILRLLIESVRLRFVIRKN